MRSAIGGCVENRREVQDGLSGSAIQRWAIDEFCFRIG
jgi:hypothetical protein